MSAADLQEAVYRAVDENATDLHGLSRYLWENPELALQEVKCHKWLTDFLEARDFKVTRHFLLDTAFKAEFVAPGGSDGPAVAFLAEYDALPDMGHACGHNLIAENAIGAALAVREAMKKYKSVRGKIVVLGTPAEESCGGKQLLVEKGALEGIDAAIMCHPGRRDVLRLAFTATQQMVIRFKGKAAHAAASPWEGLNALDAAVASYLNIGLLRQQIKPTSKIQGIIVHGGTYPNIIPEESELKYHVRAPTTDELVDLVRRVENCFHGAAQAAGCSVDIEKGTIYKHVIQNAAIARAYRKHAQALAQASSSRTLTCPSSRPPVRRQTAATCRIAYPPRIPSTRWALGPAITRASLRWTPTPRRPRNPRSGCPRPWPLQR
nr:peptidase M20 domain-containing protein 2-like isoform X2 [Rhipicephalus microplus]